MFVWLDLSRFWTGFGANLKGAFVGWSWESSQVACDSSCPLPGSDKRKATTDEDVQNRLKLDVEEGAAEESEDSFGPPLMFFCLPPLGDSFGVPGESQAVPMLWSLDVGAALHVAKHRLSLTCGT